MRNFHLIWLLNKKIKKNTEIICSNGFVSYFCSEMKEFTNTWFWWWHNNLFALL
jgi:hypothetical protein